MNTSEVRRELVRDLARDQPAFVLVWCGVNNAWNQTMIGWQGWVASLIDRLRLVRLVRVWQHDRRLERAVADHVSAAVPARSRVQQQTDPTNPTAVRRSVIRDGALEEVVLEPSDQQIDADMEARALTDYRSMVADARAANVPIAFITYPMEQGAFVPANRAIRQVGAELGVPVIESAPAVRRIPADQRKILWGAHPDGAMYQEIARDLLPLVLGEPSRQGGPLVALDFETPWHPDARTDTGQRIVRHGECDDVGHECAAGAGCYRWRPRRQVCSLWVGVPEVAGRVRLRLDLRIDAFPTDTTSGFLYGIGEDAFGTGVVVAATPEGVLRLQSRPGPSECPPLPARLERGVWYRVQLDAEKSVEDTRLTLALEDRAGRPIGSVECDGRSTGAGTFTHVTLGSPLPGGTTADVTFDELLVTRAP